MSEGRLSNDEVSDPSLLVEFQTNTDRVPRQFLSHLTTLLTSTHAQSHGSIFLIQKTLPPSPSTSEETSISEPPPQILIRATNGASKSTKARGSSSKSSRKPTKPTTTSTAKPKIRFSTVVDVTNLEDFYARYAEVCKKGMEGLRKRDKKKAKERAKAKKKGKAGG